MGTVSTTLPSDGQTIDASDVNTPINAILSEFNGNIDDNNIKTGANINGAKLLAGSIPGTAFDTTLAGGWLDLADVPDTVTYNGNRSYSLVFNSNDLTDTVSEGMRLRLTRTVSAPTQCADLESGSSHYFSKATPNKFSFTNNFVISAWIKLESYTTGVIVGKTNGTSGFNFYVGSDGRLNMSATNAGAGNSFSSVSYQSIPLGKWTHVAGQLDMTTTSTGTTNNYLMIDGVEVPNVCTRAGTNPTALVQAGNLEIGSQNTGTSLFDGKIAQVAIYNAKVTQATIKASMNQTLSGSETSIVSAYSLSNSLLDLNTTTPNDLTANNGVTTTTSDSPFGNYLGGTLEYAVITAKAFSTNTTLTVQVPEGCAIPTSGGVSAVSYSTQSAPYGFPRDKGRWRLQSLFKTQTAVASNATFAAFASGGWGLTVGIGTWKVGYSLGLFSSVATAVYFSLSPTSITGVASGSENTAFSTPVANGSGVATDYMRANVSNDQTVTSASTYLLYTLGATTGASVDGDQSLAEIFAEFNLI